jgi:diacylglycerol kinase (ATP)
VGIHAALAAHPDSGRGAAAKIAGTVAARLRDGVDRLDLLVATTVAESRARMNRSAADGVDVLVVLGGDGPRTRASSSARVPASRSAWSRRAPETIWRGRWASPMIHSPRWTHSSPACGPGRRLAGRTRRRIDLGKVGETWFATVLCCGFDACVNERANSLRWPSGPRRYDVAIIAELAAFRPRPVLVRTESETLALDATLVAIGNTAWYGGGVPICPAARPDDGVFDVTVVGKLTRRELLRMLPSLRTGRHLDHPAVRTLKASDLDGNEWPAYADGEPLGSLPVSVRCVPGALTVV